MRIVAFIDRSLYAQSVVDHAIWLAKANKARVDLVHIISPRELLASQMPPIHPGGPVVFERDELLDTQLSELRQAGQDRLEEARTKLNAQGVEDVTARVLEGTLSELMTETATGATIVIMGKRGENADLARLPLGANLEWFVRSNAVPVLAVSRSYRPVHKMLVAVDLDPAAASAVATVARGILPRMPVHLLHVGPSEETLVAELDRAAALLTQSGYAGKAEIVDGIARQVVPERVVTEGIDLVAMGAFGGSRLKSLIFGSLTTELIRACQVPILLCQ